MGNRVFKMSAYNISENRFIYPDPLNADFNIPQLYDYKKSCNL